MKLHYFALGILLSCSSAAWAAHQTSTVQGLGTVAPGTQDRSLSPRWHVYIFVKDGIEYVQVNDTAGRVRAGFAASNGTHLVLPMGADAANVSTPEAPAAVGTVRGSELVYKDALITLTAGVSDAGQNVWTVTDTNAGRRLGPADESNCKEDPNSCPINRFAPPAAPASNCKEDPNSCPINRFVPQAAPADEASNCKEDPNSCPINRIAPAARLAPADEASNCKEDPNSCPINRIDGQ